MGQFGRAAGDLHEDAVDASPVLHVQVGVEVVAGLRHEADHLPHLDVLLEGEPQIVDGVLVGVHGRLTLGRDGVGQLLDGVDEVGGLGDEVALRLQLDQGGGVVDQGHRDGPFDVLAPGPLGHLAEPALAQPGRRGLAGSPSVSTSAFLASIIPAPVASRSAFTSWAVNSAIALSLLL